MKILDDIFRKRVGNTFVDGLVDATNDEEFRENLSSVQESWPQPWNLEKYTDYFDENKAVLHDTMCRNLSGQSVA